MSTNIDVVIEGVAELDKKLAELESKASNFKLPLSSIGENLLLSHEDRFDKQESPDGQAWRALSPAYQKVKPQNQDRILYLSGHLSTMYYQSTADRLEFGSDADYGNTHQYGDESRNIPARPFLGINKKNEDDMIDILRSYFLD